jgi:acyl-CoA reductase-like NAD-dependent aldehyde dehydrogenase
MEQLFIGGEYVDSTSTTSIEVENPAREEQIAEVPDASPEDIDRAVADAARAQRDWRGTDALTRCDVLYECANRLEENVEELAVALTLEGGKTLKENFDEIRFSATQFRYVAEVSRSERGRVVGATRPNQLNLVLREPVGVVAHILPYNYPVALLSWQVPAALAAGNACVVKPAEQTPLATLKLGRVLDCLPPGLFNVVTAGAEGSSALVKHAGTRMIAFTGSVATGARIMEAAAPRIKQLLLELGGSDPFIVLGDAKLDMAVEGGVFAAFLNAGQVCTSAERFFVEDGIYDEFMAGVVELTGRLRVGDPMDEVDVGAMVSAEARRQTADAVDRLVGAGAQVVAGGGTPSHLDRGHFYEPTILELSSREQLPSEEVFGPVAAVSRVRGLDEAIELANESDLGLGASIYTSDLNTAMRAATELQAGTVWINDPLRDNDAAPFGGQKMSGLGRELGVDGLAAFTETKHVHIDYAAQRGEDWWFPYERPELKSSH